MKRTLKGIFRGLAGRTVILVMGSIVASLVVLSLLLLFGMNRILASWNVNEKKALDSFIGEKLLALAIEAQTSGAEIRTADIARVLEGLPYSPSWIAVADPRGELLYSYREADFLGAARGPGRNGQGRAQGMQGMMGAQGVRNIQDWKEVSLPDGSLAFRYGTVIPAFDERESNRLLLGASRIVVVWGLAIATIVSFTFALIFAFPLKRQSASLVSALERMASGERNLSFPPCTVVEFEAIARASAILQKSLLEEESLRRQWAADVAHDFRTPLAALGGQVEGMIDGVFAPDPARLLRLGKEVARLEALVASLGLLSRIETPGFAPARKRIDVGAFLYEVAERFKEEAAGRGSPIILQAREAFISADPGLLERAVGNLVSNAIKYGVPGGSIRLLGLQDAGSGKTEMIVENEGAIDPQILPHVFDRLFRGDGSRNTEGSGLGLSIAQAIAKAHGGNIQAVSDPDANRTRFIVALPPG